MKRISQWLLVVAVTLVVGTLGYYAYILETGTLTFPFIGQEKQIGSSLSFVVARPKFIFGSYDSQAIDSGAITRAMMINGMPYDLMVSGESPVYVSGEFVNINFNDNSVSNITIDADVYNASRNTRFRLPRNITLTNSNIPQSLEIVPVGLPREKKYQVTMYGYPDMSPDDVRWYINTSHNARCDISEGWNSLDFSKVKSKKITENMSGQKHLATYTLEYDSKLPDVCIIAGVGGGFYTVIDRKLSPFSATGSIIDVLSPEYEMKSQLSFQFSEDIYVDTGTLYSPEYIKNRSDAKLAFLKNLEISPSIPLTEDNIVLTPNRVSILGEFHEGQQYTISIKNIPDVYGRNTSTIMNFFPQAKPFLSLAIDKRRTIFRYGESIPVKLFSLKAPRDTYTVKLCRISLEGYSKVERMIAEGKKEYTELFYDLFSSRSDVSACVKKDIVIQPNSIMSMFDVREFFPEKEIRPGLYVLAFRNQEDVTSLERFVSPRVFSVVDSHITMKVDASGKMSFLVTDIKTGKPLPNQSITIAQNITKTFTEKWNPKTKRYDISYLPIIGNAFATGIAIGTTDHGGFLSVQKDRLQEDNYYSPYSLMQEYLGQEYEGGYSSFLTTSSDNTHFGYVVSTWNDGITGWNFGLKDSDYSWETRPNYSAYIHTDRKLYHPGEKVFVHAILRKNETQLTIPKDTSFVVTVNDPTGVEVKRSVMKPNDFGTIALDFSLTDDTMLGAYTVNIALFDDTNPSTYVENGYTSFQVEVFKNPTFTAQVMLKSPDIDDGVVSNLRKKVNTDQMNPWYTDIYTSVIALEGIVKAHYYNGTEMRGVPFSYKIFRSPYYPDSYWNDCFWGCYSEASPDFYTEGTGVIDSDGMGFFRVPIDFSSYYNDYTYTAEITITDPMTGEVVVTPGTLLAKMPAAYKSYAFDNPIDFIPVRKILKPGEKITGKIAQRYGDLDKSLTEKYAYSLIHRTFDGIRVDDLRLSSTFIPTQHDEIIASGALSLSGLSIETRGLRPGEYHLMIAPKPEGGVEPPESSISDTLLYISGDFVNGQSQLRVIPEKTVYRIGEKARVFIMTPFTGGYLYITRERGGIINHEYLPIQGNSTIKEYIIDDSYAPNVYIGVVAFPGDQSYDNRSYAVGYGEVIVDIADKKAKIQIMTNKEQYINREQVNIDLSLTDRFGNPLSGEFSVMAVDESLIRLLGNIDLDIIPKFFHKFPFTIKTSLTSIGIEKNRFLSRKGSNGGSGDKGGGGTEISSRILFKNTAFYNPSVITDASGRAKINFVLPDNVTDYRLIVIGQTRASHFGVSEKTIHVRRDYTIDTHMPYILYPGDSTNMTISAFNSTKKVTAVSIITTIGTGSTQIKKDQSLILGANASKSLDISFTVPDGWKGTIPYTVSLVENGTILDSVTKMIRVPDIPLIESNIRTFGVMTGSEVSLNIPVGKNTQEEKSKVILRMARSFIVGSDPIIQSLIQYPYGCIEQTISSTLPNAFALKFQSLFGASIDSKKAQENLQFGIKKILRLQHYSGGWKYWESDDAPNEHATPYVLRSLFTLRDMGYEIPQEPIDNGITYLVSLLDESAVFSTDPDFRAEIFWTLSRAKHSRASTILRDIDAKKLSRHGLLAYAYGLHFLGKLTDEFLNEVIHVIRDTQEKGDYWYWDTYADHAILASLLLDHGNYTEASVFLDALLREVNLGSYFVSTQTKIQILMAILKHTSGESFKSKIPIAVRSEGLIADLSLTPEKSWSLLNVSRSKLGNAHLQIKKDSTATVFYELVTRDIPKDIFSMSSHSNDTIAVSRTIEKIDESRGVNHDGVFVAASSVNDGVFTRGSLYRVTLRVKLPQYMNKTWRHLAIEDFVPGGWRPIRGIFQTESRFTQEDQRSSGFSWSHIEVKDDRILATAAWGYGDNQEYVYYFRPEFPGVYLLPPVTAYFMYRPEVYSVSNYQKIIVK